MHGNTARVPGLVWRPVTNANEVTAALREGSRARATAATALNASSSRSHALVSVRVSGLFDGRKFTALLHLVDLAGEVLQTYELPYMCLHVQCVWHVMRNMCEVQYLLPITA